MHYNTKYKTMKQIQNSIPSYKSASVNITTDLPYFFHGNSSVKTMQEENKTLLEKWEIK